jgi:hypothetical protein
MSASPVANPSRIRYVSHCFDPDLKIAGGEPVANDYLMTLQNEDQQLKTKLNRIRE